MRFVTVARPHGDQVGVLARDTVHLLPPGRSLLDLLGDDGERLHEAGERALRDPYDVLRLDTDGGWLRPPVPQPPAIRDFMTFERHVEGAAMLMGDGSIGPEWYE